MKGSSSLLLFILLLSACAKMPVHESSWYQNNLNQTNYQAASSEYQLSWNVYNNAEHLYIDIRTEYRPSITKMTRMGFQVFIDPVGKKNKELGINYPIKASRSEERSGDRQSGTQGQRPQGRRAGGEGQGAPDMAKMLERLPKTFKVQALSGNKDANVQNLPDGYDVSMSIVEGVLKYTLQLPIKDFCNPAEISELSIGFLSGASDPGGMNGSGGGPPSGGGRPQNGGGAGGGSMSSQMAEMADPIKIWFKAQLATTND